MVTLERQEVVYCEPCGMPLEYCEYSPDFDSHCTPWVKKNFPHLVATLKALDKSKDDGTKEEKAAKPDKPWSVKERLIAFYEKYVPDKVDGVDKLLEKYAGKEDKLFEALVKKYGDEPHDPYYSESEDEDDENIEGEMGEMTLAEKKKRRGAAARKKASGVDDCHVVVQKIAKNKKRILTNIVGMESVPGVKLKDVSKAFSKAFAGSSSVKDGPKGKEIIIQGDHMYDAAEMIVDKFKAPEDCVFLNLDGELVPLRD